MRRYFGTILPLLSLLVLVGGCDDEDPADLLDGPYDLTFEGDASFQGAHGGQDIAVAVIDAQENVIDGGTGTVSADDDPAFSFTFMGILEDGEPYAVRYWVDSNFGGGEEGVCDEPSVDHQWQVELGFVEGHVTQVEEHSPGDVTAVCDSF